MPSTRPRRRLSSPPQAISEEDYAAFIRQIELAAIWLQEAQIVNHHGPTPVEDAELHIASDSRWESRVDGFRVFHHYEVAPEFGGNVFAEINATFGVHFMSQEPMTDEIFRVFSEVNLPVNTWPYLREFVSTTMGRMNWLPFTIPALKRGTDGRSAPEKGVAPSTRSIRRPSRASQSTR